jgi:hypothetical protein
MRLYPKRLENATQLLEEKHRLKMERKEIDMLGMFSLDVVLGSSKGKTNTNSSANTESHEDGAGFGSLLGSLLSGGSMFELGMKFGAPLLRKLGSSVGGVGKKAGKNAFRWVTKEVLGGYLKWKAIELSYDGIKHVVESHKKKKETGK